MTPTLDEMIAQVRRELQTETRRPFRKAMKALIYDLTNQKLENAGLITRTLEDRFAPGLRLEKE